MDEIATNCWWILDPGEASRSAPQRGEIRKGGTFAAPSQAFEMNSLQRRHLRTQTYRAEKVSKMSHWPPEGAFVHSHRGHFFLGPNTKSVSAASMSARHQSQRDAFVAKRIWEKMPAIADFR
jgi:hypothetical protein